MRKYLAIILVLIGLSSQAQPYLVQSAKWQFKYGQRFDSAFRVYNLPILTGDTVIGFNPYSKKIGLKIISSSNSWSLTGNSPTQSQFIGTLGTTPIRFRVNGSQVGKWDSIGRFSVGMDAGVYDGKIIANGKITALNDLVSYNNIMTNLISGSVTTGTGGFKWGGNDEKITSGATEARTWRMPDSTGTVALLSNIPTNYWSTSGNTFSNGNYLGTSNNRGLPIVINGKKQVYFDTLAGVNLYDRNASRILSIYKNNSATTRSGTVYNSRPDSTNSSKAGHIFIAGGANISGVAGANYATVAMEQDWLATTSTGIASSLRVSPTYIVQSSGSGYISGITVTANNTIGGSNLYYRGLDIPSCGNNSNAYGIHQADAVGRNYFAASTQFGSTTTSTSAQVQINSTTKGFLPPVMTNAQKNAISSPATGLVVYDNGTNKLNYYNGSSWRGLDSSSGSSYTAGTGLTLTGSSFSSNLSTGISGGQTAIGGTASGNSLTLSSTSHATKGKILFGTSAYDEVNNRLGIGTASPVYPFHFTESSGGWLGKFASTSTGFDIMYESTTGSGNMGIYQDALYFQPASTLANGLRFLNNSGGATMQYLDNGNCTMGSTTSISRFAIPVAPTASANYALFSMSNTTTAFNGSTNGFATLASTGTYQAINSVGAVAYNFQDFQKNGVSLYRTDSTGKSSYAATITTGGTTGNQTINKPTGTVNIAAAGTTVTVTNSLVSATSIVYAVIRTGDATATIKNVVPSSGSFIINLAAAATSEVSIGFIVFN